MSQMVDHALALPEETKLMILWRRWWQGRKGENLDLFRRTARRVLCGCASMARFTTSTRCRNWTKQKHTIERWSTG